MHGLRGATDEDPAAAVDTSCRLVGTDTSTRLPESSGMPVIRPESISKDTATSLAMMHRFESGPLHWCMLMLFRVLSVAFLYLIPTAAFAQSDTGPPPDIAAIHRLIGKYTEAVDKVDPELLSDIWSHSPEVSFIYPLGEERGFDAIEQHVFQQVMGGMFSTRDLQPQGIIIHVNGNAAWSEFHWVFHATMRKDGSAVTTRGVETQIYRKEHGNWRLVHVHYSESR
jgi:ketosteroid isomerase-like protein